MDLVSQNRDHLAPVIISMLDAASSKHIICITSENQIGIDIKESTYCVLGLCAADLTDFVDFSGLLGSFMIKETLNKSNE
jgi:hypothetical protein